MSADFDLAFEVLMEHEGGYVDDKDDPGGATKYGISLRWLQSLGDMDGDGWLDGDLDRDGDVDANDIRMLTPETAKEKYFNQFWNRYRYDAIKDQKLATKVLCLSVHAGPRRGHLVLQKALQYHTPIVVDGIIGPMTRAAANMVEPTRAVCEFRHETAAFYRSLVDKKPGMWKYANGWMNRAYA